MKKLYLFLSILTIFLITTGKSDAQSVKLGVGGGLTILEGPDVVTKDIINGGEGFSNGYHLGLKVKLSIPFIPLTPYGHITYHKFSSSTTNNIGMFETSQSIVSIGLGAEWTLVPGPISPYLALELASNNFGDLKVTAPLLTGLNRTETGVSRVGGAIGVGTEITIIPVLNFDISAKYNWFNLIGKSGNEETISAITLNALVMFGSK